MNLIETLKMRQSCREFQEKEIRWEDIKSIVEAASAAPVGMRKYEDIKISIVINKDARNQIEQVAKEKFNKSIYSIYGAPCVILVSGKKLDEPYLSMLHTTAGCMIENMSLVSTSLGLGSVLVSGITKAIEDKEELCEKLKIPKDFKPLSALVIGWPKVQLLERKLVFDRFQVDLIE